MADRDEFVKALDLLEAHWHLRPHDIAAPRQRVLDLYDAHIEKATQLGIDCERAAKL